MRFCQPASQIAAVQQLRTNRLIRCFESKHQSFRENQTMQRKSFDRDEIAKAVALHFGSNGTGVYELRALPTNKGIVSGYYNWQNQAALVDAAARLSGNVGAVYMTLNSVLPDLLARSANRVHVYAKHTTRDAEIARRDRLLFDCDPKRPAGISA